jgi:hypothetical protein
LKGNSGNATHSSLDFGNILMVWSRRLNTRLSQTGAMVFDC